MSVVLPLSLYLTDVFTCVPYKSITNLRRIAKFVNML